VVVVDVAIVAAKTPAHPVFTGANASSDGADAGDMTRT
jgi:hypothetical protein